MRGLFFQCFCFYFFKLWRTIPERNTVKSFSVFNFLRWLH